MLNKAVAAIEEENDVLDGVLKDNINFNKKIGQNKIPDQRFIDIFNHFNKFPTLINENFEFPDLLGAAYEYLIKYFADSAGKKGGEFYTPSHVVRLLVNLLKPEQGMEIYDPAVGSGVCSFSLFNMLKSMAETRVTFMFTARRIMVLHGRSVK